MGLDSIKLYILTVLQDGQPWMKTLCSVLRTQKELGTMDPPESDIQGAKSKSLLSNGCWSQQAGTTW